MKFTFSNDSKVKIFGKAFNSMQYLLLLGGCIFFLMFIWPLLSRSYFIIPFAVAFGPAALAEVFSEEVFENATIYKVITLVGIFLTTTIYVVFFLDNSFFVKLLHYPVYYTFGYIWLQKLKATQS